MAKTTKKALSRQSGNKTVVKSGRSTTGKPPKPYKDFPLTAHPSGHWVKKIRRKLHYFGPWGKRVNGRLQRIEGDGWQTALEKYQAEKDDLQAGRTPRVHRRGCRADHESQSRAAPSHGATSASEVDHGENQRRADPHAVGDRRGQADQSETAARGSGPRYAGCRSRADARPGPPVGRTANRLVSRTDATGCVDGRGGRESRCGDGTVRTAARGVARSEYAIATRTAGGNHRAGGSLDRRKHGQRARYDLRRGVVRLRKVAPYAFANCYP